MSAGNKNEFKVVSHLLSSQAEVLYFVRKRLFETALLKLHNKDKIWNQHFKDDNQTIEVFETRHTVLQD